MSTLLLRHALKNLIKKCPTQQCLLMTASPNSLFLRLNLGALTAPQQILMKLSKYFHQNTRLLVIHHHRHRQTNLQDHQSYQSLAVFSDSQLDDSSNIYQQPPTPFSVTHDIYDNVHITNAPLTSNAGQTTSGFSTHTGDANEGGVLENGAPSSSQEVNSAKEEATDGTLEIDSGGMGCINIQKAMEERRQILKETETKEGVVLLSVQNVKEENAGRFETYGMCVCSIDMHTHPCILSASVLIILHTLIIL